MATLTIGGKTALTQTDTEEPILKNNVLIEKGIIDGDAAYGYAQLKLINHLNTQGNITWETIVGDTTNITKPSSNHVVRLAIAGIYLIQINFVGYLSDNESGVAVRLYSGDGVVLQESRDSIEQADSTDTNCCAALTYVANFSAGATFYVDFMSDIHQTAKCHKVTHGSVVLLRRTA